MSDASEVKEEVTAGRRFAGREGSEIESGDGTPSAVRTDDVGDGSLSQLIAMHEDALDTDDETVVPSFDLDSSARSDSDHLVENFCEDWVCHLDRDDRVSLGLFLCFQLTKHF